MLSKWACLSNHKEAAFSILIAFGKNGFYVSITSPLVWDHFKSGELWSLYLNCIFHFVASRASQVYPLKSGGRSQNNNGTNNIYCNQPPNEDQFESTLIRSQSAYTAACGGTKENHQFFKVYFCWSEGLWKTFGTLAWNARTVFIKENNVCSLGHTWSSYSLTAALSMHLMTPTIQELRVLLIHHDCLTVGKRLWAESLCLFLNIHLNITHQTTLVFLLIKATRFELLRTQGFTIFVR